MLDIKFLKRYLQNTRLLTKMGRKHARSRKRDNGDRKVTDKDSGGGGGSEARKPYENIVKENENFVTYYRAQKVCKEEEWDEFLHTMKSDLPSTFRITGSKEEAKKMLEIVQGQFLRECLNQKASDDDDDGGGGGDVVAGKPASVSPLPWYPDKLAWQLNVTRKDIRRSEAYFKLHNFLITETENGTISRQETVSMIPPLLLDIRPHHKVLDMCAAPGSKTAQIIEMLHGEGALPKGYVIANDIDNKRCYMLVHQAKRLNSPCMAVTNHDSAILPNFLETLPDGDVRQVRFDRVLCDVPCSGDGTMRKNPDIWMKWTAANCLHQHVVQTRILKRGAELVSVGGRLVYSTCSLNPLENEAVIHRVLSEAGGALRLVDVANALPGLKYSPGLRSWLVASKSLEFYRSFEEVPAKWRTVIRPQMFPPKADDGDTYNLARCIRILPQHQNTGAFFVAVLEKLGPLGGPALATATDEPATNRDGTEGPAETTTEAADDVHKRKRGGDDAGGESQRWLRKKRRFEGYREDPFVFFGEDEPLWPEIRDFYRISGDFDPKCLLTRCYGGKKKNLYFTSPAVRDLVLRNQHSVKFINTGIRTFVRSDNRNMKCAFRLTQEGLESIFNYVGDDRKVRIPRDDLITLLSNDDLQKPPMIESLSETIRTQLADLSPGSCVLIYKEDGTDDPLVLHINGWRGMQSLRVYTALPSTVHLLRLLGGDVSKYTVNKFKKPETDEGGERKEEAVSAAPCTA